ncbi:MAG: prolipoprotein diacylglyceryl transferase [Collinsella sp.]|nr:prolipoprotein diacylglyceryl transferase [Collinsella sp.]
MLNDLYHALDPVAFSAGPITIYWYGISYIVGAVIACVVLYRTQRRWGLDLTVDDVWTIATGIVFGLIVGGRLFYVIFYGDGYYLDHPLEVLAINQGGMSFHGGLVGGAAGGVIACRLLGISAWTVADLASVGTPLALALGRCANFVNGELWGKPTDLPWGVVFGGVAGDIPRHPSQLYEALLEGVVLFAILWIMSRRKPVPSQGTLIGTFVMGYGVARFLVEFVRVPDAQLGYIIGDVITMGQILSVPLILVGAAIIWMSHRRARPQIGHLG